jgi:hypothetical protein
MPAEVTTPAFPDWCARRLQAFAPLLRWMTTALTDMTLDRDA